MGWRSGEGRSQLVRNWVERWIWDSDEEMEGYHREVALGPKERSDLKSNSSNFEEIQ